MSMPRSFHMNNIICLFQKWREKTRQKWSEPTFYSSPKYHSMGIGMGFTVSCMVDGGNQYYSWNAEYRKMKRYILFSKKINESAYRNITIILYTTRTT